MNNNFVNITSNYVFKFVNIGASFLLIPIYLNKLGISSYGIIGFYSTLISGMVVFDLGMGITINKIIANSLGTKEDVSSQIRFFEIVYWSFAIFLGILIILFSSIIAENWLNIDDLSLDGSFIIKLMGMTFLFQWPISFYEGGIIGQRKLVNLNVTKIFFLIIQAILLIIILLNSNYGLEGYFITIMFISAMQVFSLRYIMWKQLKQIGFNKLNKAKLKKEIFFSSGVSAFSILSLIVFQTDRIAISKFFTTSELGLYSTAAIIPFLIFNLVYPITSAIFPVFASVNNNLPNFKEKLKEIYYYYSEIIFFLTTIFFFSIFFNINELLNLWLKNAALAEKATPIAKFLLLGTYFHSFTNLSINLLLARGQSKKIVEIYIITVIVYFFLISVFYYLSFGISGFAVSWAIMNFLLLFMVIIITSNYLENEKSVFNWAKKLVFKTLIIGVLILVFNMFVVLIGIEGFLKIILSMLFVSVISTFLNWTLMFDLKKKIFAR